MRTLRPKWNVFWPRKLGSCWLLAIVLFQLGLLSPAWAENLIVSLSSDRISITSNFTGAQLTVFGAIERDSATVARSGNYDVTVSVRGPRGAVTIREKMQAGPFWLNLMQRKYIAVPAFISVLSNRPLSDIASPEMRQKLFIGVGPLVPQQNNKGDGTAANELEFREALIRLRTREGLFSETPRGVTFLSPNLFRATIKIPGIVPLGNYDVDIAVFVDNVQLAKKSAAFTVSKSGIEQTLAVFSYTNATVYGLLVCLIAVVIGWIASVVFRRD